MPFLKYCLILPWILAPLVAAEKSILFIAGPKSHGPGQHEHPAACELLAKHLQTSGLPVRAEVSQGWPADAEKITAADVIVIYSDGLAAHAAKGHVADLQQRFTAGKGLVVIHWALETGDPEMDKFFDEAIGGHFDPAWSVNPVWKMTKPFLAEHQATRGVSPFEIEEEFYYHIRLRDDAVSLLRALPPESSLGSDGPRTGNPAVRKELADKVPQALAWVVENPNKSRGFGFTGGHFFNHWGNPDFRKLVLNSIAWTAGIEVPQDGVTGKVAATPAYQTIDEAIAKGDIGDVRLHIETNPASANKGGKENSRPPLEQAILRNKAEIAVLLLEKGADANSTNASKRTPLHLAIDRNNPVVITALLKAGAKPNMRDNSGWTPLHHAGAKNQLETARALLDGGADPMTLSDLGGTPLHEAAASGGAEIIKLLLDHKVDPTLKSKEGVTALDLAKKYNNKPAIEILSGLPAKE
ncbi:MAG: ankyrin repeat domain-containing protein [Verrucomicrobiota bacterium]